jgi:hypothetical protein
MHNGQHDQIERDASDIYIKHGPDTTHIKDDQQTDMNEQEQKTYRVANQSGFAFIHWSFKHKPCPPVNGAIS